MLPEPRGQRIIFLIDWDPLKVIKENGYKIFTGLFQRTINVLGDPDAGFEPQEGAAMSPASSGSVSGED